MDREGYGPEFDDRLIKLVKENAAIYDISHPHYRRTPLRMAIWDKIAKQLGAPSRFLQTKWKNIRYNYLQEQKCLETGTVNTNIRKRRFTEDLSFLKYTAIRRDGITPIKSNCNGSDDSNSYMNSENVATVGNTYEVIELDHSDDETEEFVPDVPALLAPLNEIPQQNRSPIEDHYDQPDNPEEIYETNKNTTKQNLAGQQQCLLKTAKVMKRSTSPANSNESSRSSPLLTPLSKFSPTAKNGGETKNFRNGNSQYSEVTIQPLPTASVFKRQLNFSPNDHASQNNIKRSKSTLASSHIDSDPIELYCLSLADSFRSMPRSERERVKFEFARILKDAHYKDQL